MKQRSALITGYLMQEDHDVFHVNAFYFDLFYQAPSTIFLFDELYVTDVEWDYLQRSIEEAGRDESPFLEHYLLKDLVDLKILCPLPIMPKPYAATLVQDEISWVVEDTLAEHETEPLFDNWMTLKAMYHQLNLAQRHHIHAYTWSPVEARWLTSMRTMIANPTDRQLLASKLQSRLTEDAYDLGNEVLTNPAYAGDFANQATSSEKSAWLAAWTTFCESLLGHLKPDGFQEWLPAVLSVLPEGTKVDGELAEQILQLNALGTAARLMKSKRVKPQSSVAPVDMTLTTFIPHFPLMESLDNPDGTENWQSTYRRWEQLLRLREDAAAFRAKIWEIAAPLTRHVDETNQNVVIEQVQKRVQKTLEEAEELIIEHIPTAKWFHRMSTNGWVGRALSAFGDGISVASLLVGFPGPPTGIAGAMVEQVVHHMEHKYVDKKIREMQHNQQSRTALSGFDLQWYFSYLSTAEQLSAESIDAHKWVKKRLKRH